MFNSISHNSTNRQEGISYYCAIAQKKSAGYLGSMKNNTKVAISKKHRAAIRRALVSRDISVDPICKKAGFSEGTLRNFLNADGEQSMTVLNVELLADAIGIPIGELLGEETYSKIDEKLMLAAAAVMVTAAKKTNRKLDKGVEMMAIITFYNHLIEDKRKGEVAEPSLALASFILKQVA